MHSVDEILSLIASLDDALNLSTDDLIQSERIEGLRDKLFLQLGAAILQKDISIDYSQQYLISYLRSRDEFLPKVLVPGIFLSQGAYTAARDELSLLQESEFSGYKFVQENYLDFLEAGLDAISESELSQLYDMSQSYELEGSYARPIYYALTGQRIRLPKKFAQEDIDERAVSTDDEIKVTVYPNPSERNSEILVFVGPNTGLNFNLRIMNVEGRIMHNLKINSGKTINVDTEGFDSGVYIIQVADTSGEVVWQDKLIIL